ncbi:MAG: hypothetical protein QME75_02740 [Deltaproteobacteria bacterium]|nr:hypothetical protein [Deltaproteobacteria bacterium]
MIKDRWLHFLSAMLLLAAGSLCLAGSPAFALSWKPVGAPQHDFRDPVAVRQIVTLEPFYLIQEQGEKVWIERVIMTFMLDHSQKLSIYAGHPEQRSMLFDILASESDQDCLPAKVKAAMNKALGIPVISSVHLSRSFLLF